MILRLEHLSPRSLFSEKGLYKLYVSYIGIMEKKMETTILGVRLSVVINPRWLSARGYTGFGRMARLSRLRMPVHGASSRGGPGCMPAEEVHGQAFLSQSST